MRTVTHVTIIFLFAQFVKGQSKIDFLGGYGFYEGLHLGAAIQLKKGQSLSSTFGIERWTNKNEKYYSLGLAYDFPILRTRKNSFDEFKWFLSNEGVFWMLEDDYYTWKCFSIIPSLEKKILIHEKWRMSFALGPSINFVLYNKRKTFTEVGWPYHVMPNFKIAFNFKSGSQIKK